MFENLFTCFLFLLILLILFFINTILGILIGTKTVGFNLKKLLYGILKGIIAGVCILAFFLCLEITPLILKRINIELPSDIVTFTEFIGICLTAYKKYLLDCFDKIKKIFEL